MILRCLFLDAIQRLDIFASAVLHTRPTHSKFQKYPTAATLVCEVPVEKWKQLRLGTGQLIDFVVPRELQ